MDPNEGPIRDATKPDAAAALSRTIVSWSGLRLFCLAALMLRSGAAMADGGAPSPVGAAIFSDILDGRHDGWLITGLHHWP